MAAKNRSRKGWFVDGVVVSGVLVCWEGVYHDDCVSVMGVRGGMLLSG